MRTWQEAQRFLAKREGFVRTMLGRQRRLPGAQDETNKKRMGHALRAAINTPIQVPPYPACLRARSPSLFRTVWRSGRFTFLHLDHASAAVSWQRSVRSACMQCAGHIERDASHREL